MTVPDIEIADAVIWPDDLRIRLLFELLIVVGSSENPPMFPLWTAVMFVATRSPDIDTADAVIWPDDFKIKLLFELLIVVGSIENPPITPEPVATMLDANNSPLRSALEAVICPDDFKFKLPDDAEIKFPIDVKNLDENLIAIVIDKKINKVTIII